MSRRFAAVPLIALVLALTGCAAAGPPAHSATPKPSATQDLRPWASLIAAQEQTYSKWRTPWDRDACSSVAVAAMPCAIEIVTGQITVGTISVNLDGAVKASAPKYLGTPPAPIAMLWKDTKDAADKASADGQLWSDKCSGDTSDTCTGLASTLTEDFDALQTDFAAWKPYGA